MTTAIIPKPQRLIVGEGHFVIRPTTRVIASEAARTPAEFLAEWLRNATGFPVPIQSTESDAPDAIHLRLTANSPDGAEGYRLRVTPQRIEIEAEQPVGLFYGAQTLRQLLPATLEGESAAGEPHVPAVEIEDKPRFVWRGLMLDVGRHFFPVSFVKKLLDVMALYKFNRLHLHLTEDQGWRIEIKSYPRLTEVGSKRSETHIPYAINSLKDYDWQKVVTDGKPYGGYYTQDDIREIVAYAQKHFITVVPEIEMPGHSVAALAAYPELGCIGSDYEVRTQWGIAEDVLCAGRESTYDYVESVLSEVVDLFPSEYIHIGGDECPKVHWQECPHCQAAIRREGLKDEHELQSYFVRRVEKMLDAKGRRLIGWDEILEGGLAPKATVMSWRGAQGGIEAATQGHDVVMTPNTHVYFDYYQSADVANEPLAQPTILPLEKTYAFDPTEGVPADKAGHVLGGQGNVWTEWISTEPHAEYMTFPRALALADAVWSPAPRESYEEFLARLQPHLARLEQLGVNYREP
jgi:hexosaminidase